MIFTQEFLTNMNYKAKLLRKAEVLRKTDNLRYSQLINQYKAEHRKLHLLPVNELRDLVGEFEG